MTDDRNKGVYKKYVVQRINDEKGKHNDCFFFVLDPQHDPHARAAMRAYAESCKADNPLLAADVERIASGT